MFSFTIVSRISSTVMALTAALALCALEAAATDIFWHSTYDSAMSEAKATGKPIFLEFRCVP